MVWAEGDHVALLTALLGTWLLLHCGLAEHNYPGWTTGTCAGGRDLIADLRLEALGWRQGLVPQHHHAVGACDQHHPIRLQVGELHCEHNPIRLR